MSTAFHRTLLGGALAMALGTAALAEVPRVATDIAPVHGLVARVMQGLGTPELIVAPGASPHGYAMRPSEARALEQAAAVFWIGPELAPWLEGPIETLAPDARVTELLEAPGTTRLAFREGAVFDDNDHDHGGHAQEDHAEHDHEAHDHEAHAGHDHDGHEEHVDKEHADHAGHDHEGTDPHAWLDPENAKLWLDVIAAELSALDPENAETYRSNAAAGQKEIAAATEAARATLAEAGEIDFVVFHDAYHYFENRFGIAASGSITLSDASDPSPARIEEVRNRVTDLGVACVFSEPQFNQRLVATVTDGTGAQPAVIDPLGFDLTPGADFYPALLRSLAEDIAGCKS